MLRGSLDVAGARSNSAGNSGAGPKPEAIKRAIDIAIAVVALPVCVPIMGLLALVTLAAHGRPIMFKQVRVARGGSTFTLPKFRTMTDARDASGELLPDEQRVTPVGNAMRRFRVDELPSLIAVLKGDLSLVGPRPLPPTVLATIEGSERRHCVRPGFTGLSQISGNTLLSNREKLALDLYYIRHWTLAEDFRILSGTLATIVGGEKRNEALIERALAEEHEPLGPGGTAKRQGRSS
jgi:lipopolysaccharide/colanic/teichoic acid biosynthesis glycosyltransferase